MGGCVDAERWVAVPRQRDGWLRQRDVCHSEMDGRGRDMGGCAKAERWLAEAERWVAVLWRGRVMCVTVRWMAEAERWVAVPRQRDGWLRQIDRCHSEMDGRGREMGG